MSSIPPATVARVDNPVFDASQPRSVILLNKLAYLPVSWEVHANGHGATDDATITLPIKGNPDFSAAFAADGLTNAPPIPVEIWAGFPPNPQIGSATLTSTRRSSTAMR